MEFGGGNSFEKRFNDAAARRKAAAEEVPPTPPAQEPVKETEEVKETSEPSPDVEKQHFILMPGEVAEAPDGGDFVLDANADTSASGVFSYKGNILRPATPTEKAEINAITANAETRQKKGARRLTALDEGGAEAQEKNEDANSSSKTADGLTINEIKDKLDASKPQRMKASGPKIKQTEPYHDPIASLDNARDAHANGRGGGNTEVPRSRSSAQEHSTGPIFEGAKGGGIRDWNFDARDYIDTKVMPLKKIANDPVAADYFGKLISSMDPDNAKRILSDLTVGRPLSRQESRMVLYAQHEYSRRHQEWVKYKEEITMSDLKNYAARNEGMNQILHSVGEEEALEFFKNELLENGMRNKDVFDNTIKSIKSLKDARNTLRYRSWDRNVRELCERYHLEPEHFNAMFDMSTPEGVAKARAKMEERLHEKAGKWTRSLDWVSKYVTHTNIIGSSGHKAREAVAEAQYLQSKQEKSLLSPTSYVLSDINEHFNVITNGLSLSITEPEVAARIHQSSMRNTKPSFDRDAGPKTYSEVTENLNAKFTDEKVKEYFERDKKGLKTPGGVKWEDMDQGQRKAAIRDWEPKEVKQQKGLGLWALIFGAFTGEVLKQRKEQLSTE